MSLPGAPIQNGISQQTKISWQLRLRKLRKFRVDKHDVVLIEPTEVPKAIDQRDLPVSARHDSLRADTAHAKSRHDILGVVTIRLLGSSQALQTISYTSSSLDSTALEWKSSVSNRRAHRIAPCPVKKCKGVFALI